MIQPDRTQAPPFQLSSNYSLTQPEVFSFAGGQPLYAFRGLQQNVFKLELNFQAGKWFEPRSGVSYFTAQMLRKGTEKKTSFQIASALDGLGAHLEVVAGFDAATLSLFVLKKNFIASLNILLEILTSPTFDETELRQEKEIFVQNLRVNKEKTDVMASREIRKTVFGPQHPYGNSTEEEDVAVISPEDLKSFFRDRFTLHSAYFIGPATDDDIGIVLQNFKQAFPTTGSEAGFVLRPGNSHIVEKSGSVQSSIRLGKVCISKKSDPEYFDAVIFNHLLGGFFGSRLMKNIREEKGLTYGIYSAMHHFVNGSFWLISAEVNRQNVQQALDEIRAEVKKLQDEPVTKEELEVAINYFIGSWQSDNSTLFAVADKIRNIHQFKLPADYYQRLLGHVQAITPESIQQVGRKHFGPEDLLQVQVG